MEHHILPWTASTEAEPNKTLNRAMVNGEARLRNDLLAQIVASARRRWSRAGSNRRPNDRNMGFLHA